MNLEKLLKRAEEIDQAIINVVDQHKALIGHKTEVNFWLEQLKSAASVVEESKSVDLSDITVVE